MANDDVTDRLFPHQMVDVSAEVERPIPIGPSIRQAFVDHRRHIDGEFKVMRAQLAAALERFSPEPTPASVARKVGKGAATFGRYSGVVLAALALLQGAVKVWKPELSGPLDALGPLIGVAP